MTIAEIQTQSTEYANVTKRRYPAGCQTCDLAIGDLPGWAIEVKLARVGRDNGTYEDAAIKKILSPSPTRSARKPA